MHRHSSPFGQHHLTSRCPCTIFPLLLTNGTIFIVHSNHFHLYSSSTTIRAQASEKINSLLMAKGSPPSLQQQQQPSLHQPQQQPSPPQQQHQQQQPQQQLQQSSSPSSSSVQPAVVVVSRQKNGEQQEQQKQHPRIGSHIGRPVVLQQTIAQGRQRSHSISTPLSPSSSEHTTQPQPL